MLTRIMAVPESWVSGQDEEGLPFFERFAFEHFLHDALETEGSLDSDQYRAAREQLWALKELGEEPGETLK